MIGSTLEWITTLVMLSKKETSVIRGVGKDVMDSRTEYIGLTFYRPQDQKYGSLPCSELRIVQRMSYNSYEDRHMSWNFPSITLLMSGHVPANVDTISLNLHWKDADIFKAAYSMNKSDYLNVEVYFGNMSELFRKHGIVSNTVTFMPRISLPKAKNSKFLRLTMDETLPKEAIGSSLITINRKWGAFWDDSWMESKF